MNRLVFMHLCISSKIFIMTKFWTRSLKAVPKLPKFNNSSEILLTLCQY